MKGISTGWILVFVLAVIGLGITGGLIQMQGFSVSGFTSMSLSNVDFISNDATVGGKAWLLTTSINGAGQSAVGNFDASQIKDTSDNVQSQNSISLVVEMNKETCEYNIQKTYYTVDNAQYETYDAWMTLGFYCDGTFSQQCLAKGGIYAKPTGYKCSCFTTSPTGTYGTIGTPSLLFNVKTTATKGTGTSVYANINNIDKSSAWLGNDVYVSWAGSLVSGEQCPIASDSRISAVYYNGYWKTIDDTLYQTYKTYDESGFIGCINNYIKYGEASGWTPQRCVNDYNYKANSVISGKSFNNAMTSGMLTDGKVLMELDKIMQFPVLTWRVKADWLGIYVPVGKPKIVSLTSNPFQTGTDGYITARIRNDGEALGSFEVSASCESGFSQVGTSSLITLEKGQETDVFIRISASCNSDTTKRCEVTARDRNNPNIYDSYPVYMTCQPILNCNPFEKRCNGNLIQQCDSTGVMWTNIEICDVGCEMSGNEPVCTSDDLTPVCDWKCQLWKQYGTLIIILLSIFAFLMFQRWQ